MKLNEKSKILKIQVLEKVVQDFKKDGKVVGLCHGCFDVIHFGHLIHFNEASEKVDILIASVTPDRFVNKGPSRPIFGEKLRTFFLENIRSIDYVVLNDTDNALRPLGLILPHFYFKGGDYIENKSTGYLIEESYCKEHGITLVHTKGDRFSSTETINLLKRGWNE